MSVLQQVLGWLGVLQMFALFGVLILRRHYQRMPVFTLFAGGVALSNVVVGLHYTRETWVLQQAVAAALRFGVALELTYCIFGAFPAAAATARRVMFVILGATALTVISASTDAVDARSHAEAIPRLGAAAVWILTALAVLVLWYRLPLAPLPRAILMGYAPYLLVFTIGLSLLFDAATQHLRPWIGYVDAFTFFVLVHYWCKVAWRTPSEATMPHAPAAAAGPAVPVPHQAS